MNESPTFDSGAFFCLKILCFGGICVILIKEK